MFHQLTVTIFIVLVAFAVSFPSYEGYGEEYGYAVEEKSFIPHIKDSIDTSVEVNHLDNTLKGDFLGPPPVFNDIHSKPNSDLPPLKGGYQGAPAGIISDVAGVISEGISSKANVGVDVITKNELSAIGGILHPIGGVIAEDVIAVDVDSEATVGVDVTSANAAYGAYANGGILQPVGGVIAEEGNSKTDVNVDFGVVAKEKLGADYSSSYY